MPIEIYLTQHLETQKLCLCGFASKNCRSSYHYGKEVSTKLEEVNKLKSDGNFDVVAEKAPMSKVDKKPIQPTTGTETKFEEAWNCLMDNEVGILGLYGMGGVGKTTILTQINNKLCEPGNTFDVVIWVVVSKDLRVERIQEEIAKKLRIFCKKWQGKRVDEKASDILRVLSKKKFVLFLDDIWEKVKLTEIGVPTPDRKNGCKLVFTTRSMEVCGRMGVDVEIEVKCLATDVALDLFQKKVGKKTLNSHSDIPKLAETIAQKCDGLPLALNVIGETMASKTTIEEWRHALNVLNSSAAKFPGVGNEILSILKFSYDNLKEDKVKSCFLYCALFPEDYDIGKDELVDYWVGERIMEESKERDWIESESFAIIGTLIGAGLLEEDKEIVKMHDVVREMALWITSDTVVGKEREKFVVQTGLGLDQIPKIENWKGVSRMSLITNRIENIYDIPECPKLLTLLLNENALVNISSEFFTSMPNLVVLDLSSNCNLTELPEKVSALVSLRYLDLSETQIQQLPGLKELKKLIYLNVEDTRQLQSVAGISSLLNLRILRLCGSNVCYISDTWVELQLVEHFDYFTASIKDVVVWNQFLTSNKLTLCTKYLEIWSVEPKSNDILLRADMDRLCGLEIFECNVSEIKIDWESKRSKMVSPLHNHRSLYNSCFQNLYSVSIISCPNLRDLTWLLFAPNVEVLSLKKLRQVKKIINKEKVANDTNVQPFGKLDELSLVDLPELESIYWDPLPFPSLTTLEIEECPKLKKLPFNSKSAERQNLDIVADENWMEQVEWEDEDTKKRCFASVVSLESNSWDEIDESAWKANIVPVLKDVIGVCFASVVSLESRAFWI